VLTTRAPSVIMLGRRSGPALDLPGGGAIPGNRRSTPDPADWIRETLLTHLEGLYGFTVSLLGCIARKHVAWYCGNHPARVGVDQ
jgi:hypothetical protein